MKRESKNIVGELLGVFGVRVNLRAGKATIYKVVLFDGKGCQQFCLSNRSAAEEAQEFGGALVSIRVEGSGGEYWKVKEMVGLA